MKSQVLHTVRCYILIRMQEKFEVMAFGSEGLNFEYAQSFGEKRRPDPVERWNRA